VFRIGCNLEFTLDFALLTRQLHQSAYAFATDFNATLLQPALDASSTIIFTTLGKYDFDFLH
jgi:hypothetical protein